MKSSATADGNVSRTNRVAEIWSTAVSFAQPSTTYTHPMILLTRFFSRTSYFPIGCECVCHSWLDLCLDVFVCVCSCRSICDGNWTVTFPHMQNMSWQTHTIWSRIYWAMSFWRRAIQIELLGSQTKQKYTSNIEYWYSICNSKCMEHSKCGKTNFSHSYLFRSLFVVLA